MKYPYSNVRLNRGIAPLIILIIAAALLAAAGGGYVIMTKTDAGKKLIAKIEQVKSGAEKKADGSADTAATGVDSIQIAAPSFDFSFSPVPSLDASAFNVGSPYVASAAGAFTGLSFKTDLSVDTDLNVELPAINADELKPKTLAQPAAPPAAQPPAAQPPSGDQGTTVNQTTCAQFASMPSAQYCSQVGDANGRTLCEQCKAAGF
ncbi:MAG: hypothetical protein WCT10_01870 [Patescibacteria group bacterium]|jgi:hypothetical protein